MADWSLLSQPNFAQAALAGAQAGQAAGKQKRLDAALGNVDLENPTSIMPVLSADPSTGAALLGAATKMAEYKHELAGKAATSDYLLQRLGLSGGSSDNGASSTPAPAQPTPADGAAAVAGAANSTLAPTAPADGQNAPITVTAHANPEAARIAMIKSDPDAYIKLETSLSGMDEAKQKAVAGITGTFDAALQSVKSAPYAQRRTYLLNHRADLIAAGVPAQQIDNFDPTDDNITSVDNQVLGVKGVLEKQDKDRQFALSQSKFGEEQRHNRVDESQGSARIGIEAQNAGTAAAHLGIDRAHLALDQKAAANKPGTTPPSRTVGGKIYYQVGGKWFDNPGGK